MGGGANRMRDCFEMISNLKFMTNDCECAQAELRLQLWGLDIPSFLVQCSYRRSVFFLLFFSLVVSQTKLHSVPAPCTKLNQFEGLASCVVWMLHRPTKLRLK